MNPWAPVLKWLAIGAAVVALLWWAAVAPRIALSEERTAHAATKASHAEVIADLAAKARHAADLARQASERAKTDRAAADARHREELTDAKREADRLRAALRSGSAELQDRWTCRVPGAGQGGAAADAREADPEGRFDSAARIVEAGDHDAAVIEWLWESWRAERSAVIAGGCAVEAPR